MQQIPPADDGYFALSPDEAAFFKAQTGIEDDEELKRHIIGVQRKAYEASELFAPYPCILLFTFLDFIMGKLPAYQQLVEIGREREDSIFLDIAACCEFGLDARRAIADGFPAQNVIISDLRPELLDFGHKFFRTTPATYPVHHLACDAFDPSTLEVVPPSYELNTSSPRPDLNSLTSLNPLHGRVSAIYAGMFFHLFNEAQQLHLARALAGLLSPVPGSLIFGVHNGAVEKGTKQFQGYGASLQMFCHSPESWRAMWAEVFAGKEEAVRVEAQLKTYKTRAGEFEALEWSVTRL
ncbi:hypothetical protein CONPUDRAFT_64653 [Coniophora puteana RWD-64-598 SS2]|uniref:Methyltransferase domain-containing protein n=1 Tax=Coniophora puteana (strain RWD-64-598) TaxID=741705 RepID=A0A5M3MB24_CONPW|nr:uncharacterized protein CONPUDRAFT_64653 [Coniophora puteana RWD-64-598 SS2]EIW76283.1 hypothetical protein CONPUDRAFT_64653 [Coniophora puteana RWD-64-598 SS2]